MCGIVGHIGKNNSVQVVLEGLKRLEYRGYDSAGVCFKNLEGELTLHKKVGKLDNLKSLLEGKDLSSISCIGHTRWATHGVVNDVNSHPHVSDNLAIVHNGIIENALEIKNELITEGYRFKSETDSEVFLVLLEKEIKYVDDFQTAISNVFKKVKGNSAFVIQRKGSPYIYSIKRGAPLVCGISSKSEEVSVSSDPYALVGMVELLFFPEDEVLCRLGKEGKDLIKFYELDGSPSKRILERVQETNLSASEKGEFEHYMLKEIHEQPGLIRSLVQEYTNGGGENLKALKDSKFERIHINACGTAYYAGLVVKNYFENINKIPASADLASEFRYRGPLVLPGDMGLFISQSGETADTLAAQNLCKEKGLPTFSIVNVEGSTLYRECDENYLIHAGVEIGVASTKAFTLQALTGRLMANALEGGSSQDLSKKYGLLAHRIENLLEMTPQIKKIAEEIHKFKGFFFTGRGMYYPVALEGALKLKEIAYVHAEGYAAGELKHGPIALIDDQMVNIAIVGPELFEKTLSNIQEIKARRGVIVTMGPENNEEIEELSDHYLPLNFEDLEELAPLYVNVANQLLAYYIAKYKGTDIDKPRNLAKSVTVE